MKELEKDWNGLFFKISLTDTLAESAASLALQHSLKGSDAVHLASAKEVGAMLFVASDSQLIRVAEKVGMIPFYPEGGPYKPAD